VECWCIGLSQFNYPLIEKVEAKMGQIRIPEKNTKCQVCIQKLYFKMSDPTQILVFLTSSTYQKENHSRLVQEF